MFEKQYLSTILDNDQPTYFKHPSVTNNSFSPNGIFSDAYMGVPLQHSSQRSQEKIRESCQYHNPHSWENIKVPDKMDLLEIGTKDLSPVSCSNIDLMVLDVTPQQNKFDNCWYPTSCNYNNFPNIGEHIRFSEFGSSITYYEQEGNVEKNYIERKNQLEIPNYGDFNGSFVQYSPIINSLNEETEVSNEESDIIVEDLEEDYSDTQKAKLFKTKCLICDTFYMPTGLEFYYLTKERPLTMSTQTPVIKTVMKIVGYTTCNKSFLCSICLGLVNTVDSLKQKLETLTLELSSKFKQRSKAQSTKPKKAKLKKYKCMRCKKVLLVKTLIKMHLKQHKFAYLCEFCGKKVPTRKILKIHLNRHKQRATFLIPGFTCSNRKCRKTFRTKSNLNEHENNCLGLFPYKCESQHCNKKFPSATKWKNHVKLKHEKKFIAICSICNIGFVKISDYKAHMTSHGTDKKFPCKKCDKSYKTLSNLNFHMKIHAAQLPFMCTICRKGFMRKEYLEAHVNNHKGIKNFNCSICDKKFVSQKNLDSHLKHHEATSKNSCNICGKIVSSNYKEHLKMHSNLKEFECDLCDLRFNTKNTLGKHKKRKHRNI